MNETKLSAYRNFRATLKAVAASLNATAIHTARMDEGVFRIAHYADTHVALEVTYTNYEYHGAPRLYIDRPGRAQTMLTNLTAANLKKHLTKELAYRQFEINRDAISDKEDSAADKAQKEMVKLLTSSLSGFTFTNADVPTWRGASGLGTIRLFHTKAYLVPKTDQFEFTFRFKYVANVSGARLEGELEARDTAPAVQAFKALYSL